MLHLIGIIITLITFTPSCLGAGDFQWVPDEENHPICTELSRPRQRHHSRSQSLNSSVGSVPINKCELDTEWVKIWENHDVAEKGLRSLEVCRPVSIAKRLDLSPYRKELAKSPHICIAPNEKPQPRKTPCLPLSRNLAGALPEELNKELSQEIGEEIGKRTLLGKGATKKVYLTHLSSAPQIPVAKYTFKTTDKAADRLNYEIHLIDGLFHPPTSKDLSGLVKPVGTVRKGDEVTRYMEYAEGDSMKKFVDAQGKPPHEKHSFKVQEAITIAKDLCRTVQALHDHHVVHRDIKPGNIFYDGKHVKLGDFDVAYNLNDKYLEMPSFDEAAMTPLYASPELMNMDWEQIKQDHPDINEAKKVLYDIHVRGDEWSVGMTLLNVIAGEFAPWQPQVANHYRMLALLQQNADPANQPKFYGYIKTALESLHPTNEAEKTGVKRLKDLLDCSLTLSGPERTCNFKTQCNQL